MDRANTSRALVLIVGLVFGVPSFAIPVTASFEGLADGWRAIDGSGSRETFSNVPITGTFSFETSFDDADTYAEPGSLVYYWWPASLTFNMSGRTSTFDSTDDSFVRWVTLADTGSQQSIGIDFFAPYTNANLALIASSGGLFDRFDLTTFDPSALDVAASYASFSNTVRYDSTSLRFTQISFDGVGQPVPEPGTLALFGLAMLSMTFVRRRTRGSLFFPLNALRLAIHDRDEHR